MKRIKIGKHIIQVYDSIEDLPVIRHHKFTKLMMIDAHIGANISDFDAHVERILRYIKGDKKDFAERELLNLRQNVFFIQSEIIPRYLAFAALVYSIDGKEITDLSDESLSRISRLLSDVTAKELDKVIEQSKKKLDTELQTYFPQLFESAAIKEYYDKLKKKVLLTLKELSGDLIEKEKEELEALINELILYADPQSFSGKDSIEIQQDKQFENACLLISQQTNMNAKRFTTLEYYNALVYIKKQAEERKKKIPRK